MQKTQGGCMRLRGLRTGLLMALGCQSPHTMPSTRSWRNEVGICSYTAGGVAKTEANQAPRTISMDAGALASTHRGSGTGILSYRVRRRVRLASRQHKKQTNSPRPSIIPSHEWALKHSNPT